MRGGRAIWPATAQPGSAGMRQALRQARSKYSRAAVSLSSRVGDGRKFAGQRLAIDDSDVHLRKTLDAIAIQEIRKLPPALFDVGVDGDVPCVGEVSTRIGLEPMVARGASDRRLRVVLRFPPLRVRRQGDQTGPACRARSGRSRRTDAAGLLGGPRGDVASDPPCDRANYSGPCPASTPTHDKGHYALCLLAVWCG